MDLDEHERIAKAATPGPWQWFGNTKMFDVCLATVHSGRRYVMDFVRWGMAQAQPRFQIDHGMMSVGDLGKVEHAQGPVFEVPYRRQFAGINHPDAIHIAHNSPDVTLKLIARIRELEEAALEAVRTIEGWVTTETQHANRDDDPDWKQAQRIRALVAKGIP